MMFFRTQWTRKLRRLSSHIGIASLVCALTAGICYPIADTIGYQTVGLIFLIVVASLSLFIDRGGLIFAAILSFTIWNFLFINPLYTFRVHSIHDMIALFANLTVAIVGSVFINRIRRSRFSLIKSQEQIAMLYSLLESLNNAISIDDIVAKTQQVMLTHFNARILIYLTSPGEMLLSDIPLGDQAIHSQETWSGALDIFRNSATGPSIVNQNTREFQLIFPLEEPRKRIGVIVMVFPGPDQPGEDKINILKSFIMQISSALDREISIIQIKQQEIHMHSEKLFRTVMNSVSHELKTPIAIIQAAVSNLADKRTSANTILQEQIVDELNQASTRLNQIVQNILDMSRIESGIFRLNKEWCDIPDLLGTISSTLAQELEKYHVQVSIADEVPLFQADITMLTQALLNILRNALNYSPPGSDIQINVVVNESGQVHIVILDQGPGIPEKELPRVFEKFFRVPGTKPGGTGLGLTISKAIIDLHGGELKLMNSPERGLAAHILLPVETCNQLTDEQL